MAPLTWRNVDAPDLSTAANAMARATQGIQAAFRAGGDIGRGIYDDQVDIGSREAMRAAQQFGSSQELGAALQNGTAFGNMDPRFINSQTLQWGDERRRGLLSEEQTVQNMEIQRNAEVRAAQAHALRMAGGGTGGGGGGGARSGSAAVRKADEFTVAQAEAARRVAVAEFGANSPEALAATNYLATVSTGVSNRGGLLDAADGYTEAITADRAEATAAGDAAVAAMSGEGGFNPYAIPLSTDSPAAGIPGSTIPLTPSAAEASPAAALPVPNATAPGGPMPVAETAPAPAPAVSGLDWGLSMGTPVGAPAPASAEAPPAAFIERPNLSFGSEVAPMVMAPAAENRPLSWSQFAQEQLGDTPTAPARTGSAASMGLPAAVEELPQWSAYQADVASFERSAQEKARSKEVEASRTTPNTPDIIKTAFDSSRSVIDTAVKGNPIFSVYEQENDLKNVLKESGPEGVTEAVRTKLGIPSTTQTGPLSSDLRQDIDQLAKENGVSFEVAAAAIVAAGGSENTNYGSFWNSNNWWRGDTFYNNDLAEDYVSQYKANEKNPDDKAGTRNSVGAIRSELSGIERAYALRMEAEVHAKDVAKARPGDPRAQKAYADARAATLAADKAAIAFRENLNERLASLGMTGSGITTRPSVNEYVTPEMQEEAVVLERERAAEAAANLETFGVEQPTFVGFQNGRFDPGNVAADSEFGLHQANQGLPVVLSGLAWDDAREPFFEWVAASPNASREIFGRIQDMEYSGQDVDLPDTVDRAYQEYTRSNVADQAINDLTTLGFDLSGDPEKAAAVMNDPEVQTKLRIWRENEGFWTRESTSRLNRQNAQAVIRAALKRNQPDER